MKALRLLLGIVMVSFAWILQPSQTQSAIPSPVAFSGEDQDYFLYNFETMTISAVTRDGMMGLNETSGFPVPPQEIDLRAPEASYGRLILVDASDPETDGVVEGGYTLFRVTDQQERIRIIGGLDLFFSAVNWSPDGRFVYLHTLSEETTLLHGEPGALYRYDIATSALELVFERVLNFESGCQRYRPDCLVVEADEEDTTSGTLYHLDRTTGESVMIAEGLLPNGSIQWIGNQATAMYTIHTPEATIVYSYDAERDILREAFSFPPDTPSGQIHFSADGRFVLVESEAEIGGKWQRRLRVYRTDAPDAAPIEIGAMFVSLYSQSQHPPQWLDGDTLAFEGQLTADSNGFYTIDLPDGDPQRVNTPSDPMYDQAWSPDGNWFAYVTREQELYVVEVTPDAEPLWIADEVSCVDWLPLEISLSGQAYLCDKHRGEG
jgi:hypothetical protein